MTYPPTESQRPQPGPLQGPPLPRGWHTNPAGGESYWDGYRWTHYRAVAPDKVTIPALGWVLLAAGVLVAVGAFMPWITALGGVLSRNGLDAGSDGIITLVCGLVLAGLGLTIGLKQ